MYDTDDLEEREGSGAGSFLAGLALGAIAGAVLGLAFAPKPGAELRQQLADSTGKLRQKAASTYNQAADAVSGAVDKGRRVIDRGREAFQSARADAEPAEPRSAVGTGRP